MTRHRTLKQLPKDAPNRNNAGESRHQDEVYGQRARNRENPVGPRQDQFIPSFDRREIATPQPTRNPVERQHQLSGRGFRLGHRVGPRQRRALPYWELERYPLAWFEGDLRLEGHEDQFTDRRGERSRPRHVGPLCRFTHVEGYMEREEWLGD